MTTEPTKDIPTIRDGFADLVAKDNAEGIQEDTVVIGDDVLIAIVETYMDFQIGKETADLRVEHPHGMTTMQCTDISVHGKAIKIEGKHDSGSIELIA